MYNISDVVPVLDQVQLKKNKKHQNLYNRTKVLNTGTLLSMGANHMLQVKQTELNMNEGPLFPEDFVQVCPEKTTLA